MRKEITFNLDTEVYRKFMEIVNNKGLTPQLTLMQLVAAYNGNPEYRAKIDQQIKEKNQKGFTL